MTETPASAERRREGMTTPPSGFVPRWQREYSALAVLFALLLFLAITRPAFFSADNLRDILVNNSYVMIAGVGATIVILAAGIDISIGSMLAACAVTAGDLAHRGTPLWLVILATLAMGAFLGLVNGGFVAWLNVPPIIVTLGTLSIYRGAVIWYTQGVWIQGLPASFLFLGQGTVWGVPVPVWVAAGTVLAGVLFLQKTRCGRHIYAIGGNPLAAELAGIRVNRIRLLTYVISGMSVGLSALVYASRFSQIQSNTGIGFELLVITAVVVGGTNIFGGVGSIWGTVCGVLLLGAVDPALAYRHISSYWEGAIQGCFILFGISGDALRTRKR